jgi:hypothetical protein
MKKPAAPKIATLIRPASGLSSAVTRLSAANRNAVIQAAFTAVFYFRLPANDMLSTGSELVPRPVCRIAGRVEL